MLEVVLMAQKEEAKEGGFFLEEETEEEDVIQVEVWDDHNVVEDVILIGEALAAMVGERVSVAGAAVMNGQEVSEMPIRVGMIGDLLVDVLLQMIRIDFLDPMHLNEVKCQRREDTIGQSTQGGHMEAGAVVVV